jgi:hypothetical protein
VNLIDKKGSQFRIGTEFSKLINNMKDDRIQYVWFDFHHECRNMKYENLSKLVDQIKDNMKKFEYFYCKLDFGLDKRDKLSA